MWHAYVHVKSFDLDTSELKSKLVLSVEKHDDGDYDSWENLTVDDG